MGYTTDFWGEFIVTPTLKPEHKAYLEAFATTRRVRRDEAKAALIPDPIREAAGLPVGFEGAYFVAGEGYRGQDKDPSILDGNEPPGVPPIVRSTDPKNTMADFGPRYALFLESKSKALQMGLAQPGLWCQWIPNGDGTAIVWDEGEKFYEYVEWIEYLIHHFLAPWGYELDGSVTWQGEETDDKGIIVITSNVVSVGIGRVVYNF